MFNKVSKTYIHSQPHKGILASGPCAGHKTKNHLQHDLQPLAVQGPYGLHEAPIVFQRLMDLTLCLYHTFVAAYLDDIVGCSSTCVDYLFQWTYLGKLRSPQIPANATLNWPRHSTLATTSDGGDWRPKIRRLRQFVSTQDNIKTPVMCPSGIGQLLLAFCTQLLLSSLSPLRPHQKGILREGEVDTQGRAGIPGPHQSSEALTTTCHSLYRPMPPRWAWVPCFHRSLRMRNIPCCMWVGN